jgi:hypothetical protein
MRHNERQSILLLDAMSSLGPTAYLAFGITSVLVLKAVNEAVIEPYMVSGSITRVFKNEALTASYPG